MTFEKKTTAFTLSLNSDLFSCHNHCCQWANLFSHKIVKIDRITHCKGNLLCARWSVACAARLWPRQRLESSSSSSDTVCAKLAHRHTAGTQVLLELETRTQAQCRPTSARRRNSHTGVLRNYTQVHCRLFAKGKPREQSAQRYTLNMHFGTCVHTDTLHAHRLHIGALQVHRQISMLQALFW